MLLLIQNYPKILQLLFPIKYYLKKISTQHYFESEIIFIKKKILIKNKIEYIHNLAHYSFVLKIF